MHDNINHRNRIAEPPYHLPHLCWWVTVFTISWCCSCGCKQATHDARATIFSFPKSTNRWCLSLGHTLAAALVFLNSRPDGLWIEWRYALLTSLTNEQNQKSCSWNPYNSSAYVRYQKFSTNLSLWHWWEDPQCSMISMIWVIVSLKKWFGPLMAQVDLNPFSMYVQLASIVKSDGYLDIWPHWLGQNFTTPRGNVSDTGLCIFSKRS